MRLPGSETVPNVSLSYCGFLHQEAMIPRSFSGLSQEQVSVALPRASDVFLIWIPRGSSSHSPLISGDGFLGIWHPPRHISGQWVTGVS